LASLESARAHRAAVVSRAELARWRQSHSAYIPGLATLGGFWRHTAAQPFNRRWIVCAVQTGFGLVLMVEVLTFGPELVVCGLIG
jgi:hypothetical protein